MKKAAGIGAVCLIICYPFLVYWGLNHLSLKIIGWIFLGVIVLRTLIFKQQLKQWIPILLFISLTTILLNIFNDPVYLKLNPVIISTSIFAAFTFTLFRPPSMIETFARLQDKNLPDKAIPYCRNVTKIWCIFLLINSLIALYTALLTDMETWALYNGLISYILMGLLFAGEFIYRKTVIRPQQESN